MKTQTQQYKAVQKAAKRYMKTGRLDAYFLTLLELKRLQQTSLLVLAN